MKIFFGFKNRFVHAYLQFADNFLKIFFNEIELGIKFYVLWYPPCRIFVEEICLANIFLLM